MGNVVCDHMVNKIFDIDNDLTFLFEMRCVSDVIAFASIVILLSNDHMGNAIGLSKTIQKEC